MADPNIPKIEADAIFHATMTCLPAITQAYRLFRAQGKTEEDFDRCAREAMTKAVRNAVELTAREVKDPVWPYALDDATGVPVDAAWLLPDDMQALQRFCETSEDSQPYDVPKDRVRRLAELGAIQWCGGARYSITAFGQHVLDLLPEGWPRRPLKTHADHDAHSRTEIDRASGNAGVMEVPRG